MMNNSRQNAVGMRKWAVVVTNTRPPESDECHLYDFLAEAKKAAEREWNHLTERERGFHTVEVADVVTDGEGCIDYGVGFTPVVSYGRKTLIIEKDIKRERDGKVEKKYELIDETVTVDGHTLYRIRAVRDFTGVCAGDIGGFVESECNLSHNRPAWIYGDAMVYGDAVVTGAARVYCHAKVYGNAKVCDFAEVCGNAEVFDNAEVSDNAIVTGNAWVYDDARIYGGAVVRGCAEVFDNAEVCGSATVYGDAQVCDYDTVDHGEVSA